MSGYDWSWYDDHAERARRSWFDTIAVLPVGAKARGRVIARMPFGVFLSIDGHPDAIGLIETPALPRDADLPDAGTVMDVMVMSHSAHNWQLRLAPASG